jgi:hypothetical protein
MMLDPVFPFLLSFYIISLNYKFRIEKLNWLSALTIILYLILVIIYGGDYMAGRFFSGLILFISITISQLSQKKELHSILILLFGFCLLFNLKNLSYPINSNSDFGYTDGTKT